MFSESRVRLGPSTWQAGPAGMRTNVEPRVLRYSAGGP